MSLNHITAIGRIVKDIEVKDAGKSKVANFTIAVDRDFKREGQPTADFFDCAAFGPSAEFLGKYGSKGRQVCVSGRLENNPWTDKEGKKRFSTSIRAENVQLLGPNNNGEGAESPVADDEDAIPFA